MPTPTRQNTTNPLLNRTASVAAEPATQLSTCAEAMPDQWQQALREAVRDVRELANLLDLPLSALGADTDPGFPLVVPRGFVDRMQPRDPNDPLLLQVLPQRVERRHVAGFGPDPVGEQALSEGGIVEKYAGRALLVTTGTCPVNCRYCFRREYPYAEQMASRGRFEPAMARLHDRFDIDEVILSGGDPLALTNHRLKPLFHGLAELPHIKRIRIHTRFPVILPERVDQALVRLLADSPADTIVVVHANHAHELDSSVAAALGALRAAGTMVLNQSVLLAGVNDSVEALSSLSERLLACGVLPYYLHLLDRVTGTAHFEVTEERALALHAGLRARLSGYLVPRLVREIAGQPGKTPIVPF